MHRVGGIVYAIWGSSSLHYVEKLEDEIKELREAQNGPGKD